MRVARSAGGVEGAVGDEDGSAHPGQAAAHPPLQVLELVQGGRVVARGGTFDTKLASLSDQALAVSDADVVAFLLHDADGDVLLSLDGELALPE